MAELFWGQKCQELISDTSDPMPSGDMKQVRGPMNGGGLREGEAGYQPMGVGEKRVAGVETHGCGPC